MAMTAIAYMLQEITSEIPEEILNVAFDPTTYQTTLDDRIAFEVLQSTVLNDINLRSGQTTRIEIDNAWRVNTDLPEYAAFAGNTFEAAFFLIPPEAREFKNITTVERVTDFYNYSVPTAVGALSTVGSKGNTVSGLAAAALESRTNSGNSLRLLGTVESNNLIRVYPDTMINGLVLECKLAYDPEFTNAGQNVIIALQACGLAAVKRWIYTKLVVKLDATALVNGSPLGTLRDIVSDEYKTASAEYKLALRRYRAATLMEPRLLKKLALAMA